MFHEISVIPARRPSISSIDRSVAEEPGIFSKPWVLGAKAAQRVCEYFHALSKSRRVHDFWINYTHVCAKENTKNSFWSVSASNSLIHAPECGKCILRDPNFQKFPGEHTPGPPRSSRLMALAKDAFGVFQYLSAYFSNSAIYSISYWKPWLTYRTVNSLNAKSFYDGKI